MRVVVVYESVFTNTHTVADAVAAGIVAADPTGAVRTLHVTDVEPDDVVDADLMVVGGPTHMRGMSSEMSRRKGAENAVQVAAEHGDAQPPIEPDAVGPGLRDWLHTLPRRDGACAAAAFDTRLESHFAGGAARGIARRLRHNGYRLVAEPEGFIIDGTTGPLREGELDRATVWGTAVATAATSVARTGSEAGG